jgi:hypothetical protein
MTNLLISTRYAVCDTHQNNRVVVSAWDDQGAMLQAADRFNDAGTPGRFRVFSAETRSPLRDPGAFTRWDHPDPRHKF